KRLVIYLDNGPHNGGKRTQWLRRLVEFCDWSGLEIRLVYYPAYHSKYNPIEHCWGVVEQKGGAALLNGLKVILQQARRVRGGGGGGGARGGRAARAIEGVPPRSAEVGQAQEGPGGSPPRTLRHSTQVRHYHQAATRRPAGWLRLAGRRSAGRSTPG